MLETNTALFVGLAPYMAMLFGLVVSLWIKEIGTNFAAGMAFRADTLFKEGDRVIVDNELAVIIKVGFRYTIFALDKDTDGKKVWRVVRNDRIGDIKLEKIIVD